MKLLAAVRTAVAVLAFTVLTPGAAAATITGSGYDFCYKSGDYYDASGTGYNVIECVYWTPGGYGMDIYYIRHGVEFKIYQY